jgi:chemotaxis protein MotB
MRNAKRWMGVAAFGVSLGLTGCVSSSQYKKVQAERNQLQQEVEAARAEAQDYQNQIGAVTEAASGKDEEITALSGQTADLQAQLDQINQQYAEALERANSPLPKALASELSEFASKNADVLEFDASRGMVKFKSDVSFAPGSVELTPKAKDVITHLAQILNNGGVNAYELMVAGHTDAMPVQRAGTIKAGHLDNWYLSAHRAISVGKALQKHEVSPSRLAMVGYADQRPVASNATEDGRAKNRRVELIILPHKATAASPEWMNTGRHVAHKSSQSHSSDATAHTDNGSALNK